MRLAIRQWKEIFFGFAFFFLFALLVLFSEEAGLWAFSHLRPIVFYLFILSFLIPVILFLFLHFAGRDINSPAAEGAHYNFTFNGVPFKEKSIIYFIFAFLIALSSFAALYHFRIRLFLPPPRGLGDSLLLIQNVPIFTKLFDYLDSFDELLELFIHSRFFEFAHFRFNLSIEDSYALLSSFAGGIYIYVVLCFLKDHSFSRMVIGISLLIFTPAFQLYAGYVENYSLTSLVISIVLMAGAHSLEVKKQLHSFSFFLSNNFLVCLALLAAFGAMLHLIAGFLAPALAYLLWQHSGRNWKVFFRLTTKSAIPAILFICIIWIYFLFITSNRVGWADSHLAHPPFYPFQQLFSGKHFVDLINQVLLGTPIPLFVFPYYIIKSITGFIKAPPGKRWHRLKNNFAITPTIWFLIAAAIPLTLDAFFHNPQLGFPADWDLFTFFQIPVNLALFYFLKEMERQKKRFNFSSQFRMATIFLFAAILTGSWIVHNATKTSESELYLADTKKTVKQFFKRHENDEIFADITDLRRKKLYVRANLFFLGSKNAIERKRDDPAIMRLMEQLNRAEEKFNKVILYSGPIYEREFPKIWEELTRINRELHNSQ